MICSMRQRARVANLKICYLKKQIVVSFSCVCPVIDNEFRDNVVKVVCGSTTGNPGSLCLSSNITWVNIENISGEG